MNIFKGFFNNQITSITSAAAVIGVASLASRLLGVIRDRVLAATFGVGDNLDIYYAAFRIPDTIFNLVIVGALSAGFIPVFSDLLERDKKQAWRLVNNILNIFVIILAIVLAVFYFFAPQLMPYIAPGFSGAKLATTTRLTQLLLLSPLLLTLSSIFGGVLQTYKRFFIFSLSPILYNVGIIFGSVFLTQQYGVYGLGIGVIIGAFLHFLIQVPTASFLGYKYQPVFDIKDKDFLHVLKLMIPRTLSLAVFQLNIFVMTILATSLASGSLTIFNFANNLQSFPLGIFGISFAIAAFPTLCELARKSNKEDFSISLSKTVNQILFFIIPVTVLFILLRAQIVRVVLGAGEFDWPATIAVADALAIFSVSLFAQNLVPIFSRAFFALKNSYIPFYAGLLSVILSIGLALILNQQLGVNGLVLSISIGSIFNFIFLWLALKYQVGTLNEKKVFSSLWRIVLASSAMGVVVQFMKFGVEPFFGTETFVGIFMQGFISGMVGLAVFVVVGSALKLEELDNFISALKRKLLKEQKAELAEKEGIEQSVE